MAPPWAAAPGLSAFFFEFKSQRGPRPLLQQQQQQQQEEEEEKRGWRMADRVVDSAAIVGLHGRPGGQTPLGDSAHPIDRSIDRSIACICGDLRNPFVSYFLACSLVPFFPHPSPLCSSSAMPLVFRSRLAEAAAQGQPSDFCDVCTNVTSITAGVLPGDAAAAAAAAAAAGGAFAEWRSEYSDALAKLIEQSDGGCDAADVSRYARKKE